jgi:hypothetical protein
MKSVLELGLYLSVVLQQLHLPGECGLGNVQTLGCAAEAVFFKDYQKATELFEHNQG